MSNIIRKIKSTVSLFTGISINKDKRKANRAKTGLPKHPTYRKSDALIYGMQGTMFENGVDPKPWQHGPHYDKHNLDGHPLDMSITDPYGDLIYVRLRSGQIVNTTKNRSDKKRKSVIRSIKKVKVLSRKAA